MPFKKEFKNTKKLKTNIIKSSYDLKYPGLVMIKGIKYGYGCSICDTRPEYCDYYDKGIEECPCDNCDIKTDYKPKKLYRDIEELIKHYLLIHNLSIDDKIINGIKKNLSNICDKNIYPKYW